MHCGVGHGEQDGHCRELAHLPVDQVLQGRSGEAPLLASYAETQAQGDLRCCVLPFGRPVYLSQRIVT